jgi:hypothetical protein
MATPAGSDGAAPKQRGRRVVQYGLIILGSLLFLDALVGEKGFVENLKARQQYEAIERSLGLMRPGEKLFIIKDAEPGAP